MRSIYLFAILFFSASVFAGEVPDGCPTDDSALQAAVANGRAISCQINYFTGGKGGQWVDRPIDPQPQATIELACISAQEEVCPGIAMCLESPYFSCTPQ